MFQGSKILINYYYSCSIHCHPLCVIIIKVVLLEIITFIRKPILFLNIMHHIEILNISFLSKLKFSVLTFILLLKLNGRSY